MTLLDVPLAPRSGRSGNPSWTDDKIEKLKTLCEEGLSAGAIAHRLGFATRNAVIGKMHRMGLVKTQIHNQSKVIQKKRFAGSTIKPQNVHSQNIHKAHYTQKKRLRISLVEASDGSPTQPVYMQPSEYDKNIPVEQRKTLMELTNHNCRWPLGDPQKPDFFFCGAITDRTYCTHHMIRAGRV